MALQYSRPESADIKFRGLFDGNYTQALTDPFPKIAHFVHTDPKELTWFDWTAVRAAIVRLQVEKVYVWLPEKVELRGWIWNRVLEIPEVRVRRIAMPKTVFGANADTPERQSDIVRLKILYEEGGISLDTDLVALKSLDDVIYSPTTRATVTAIQYRGDALPNGFIMSKPGSPFLKRWIQRYQEAKAKGNWNELATKIPYQMHLDNDPDLTVLGTQSWYYPLSAEKEGDAPLKTLWFGKSWHDIEKSYGTHFWHPMEEFVALIKPLTIQTIDTPLFCYTRTFFDNLDDDGVYAESPETNRNCTVSRYMDLEEENYRMFSDYTMAMDDSDMKLVDSSGFNNHGWAPRGMVLQHNGSSGGLVRSITADSFAVLPVPADWDARTWSVRMTIELNIKTIATGSGIGLFKIRMETGGEILIGIRDDSPYPGLTLNLDWRGNDLAKKEYRAIDDMGWVSKVGLSDLKTDAHELALTFDRRKQGVISLYLDGESLATHAVPVVASPKLGQEIWINAQEWDVLDTGFRGTLNRFTMYADVVPPQAIADPIRSFTQPSSKLSKLKSTIVGPQVANSSWALLFPCMLLMMVVLFVFRRRKGYLNHLPEYGRKLGDLARELITFSFRTHGSSSKG